MRRISIITFLLVIFSTTAAFADSLRSDKQLVKVDVQPLSGNTRQYTVKIFDAESRTSIANLNVVTKGDAPAESATTAGSTRYTVRIEPHGDAYLIDFRSDDGAEGEPDAMRGGFTTATKSKPVPARVLRAGHDIAAPAILHRIEPAYTDQARAAAAAGTVVLELSIDKSGFVRDATVVKPMGYGLDESAVDAVQQWQFTPSLQASTPVEVIQEITIDFKP